MQLTILGRYAPVPPRGGATTAYLLQHQGHHILLDCGAGSISHLPEGVTIHDLDAVVLSHLHSDHIADLAVLRYGIDIGLRDKQRSQPLTIYAPAEPAVEFARLAYRESVVTVPVSPAEPLEIYGLTFSFALTNHPMPCHAMRITDGKGVLVYTADTGLSPVVEGLATGADLLLVEASLREADRHFNTVGHLTAREAAEMGKRADAKRTLLTHLWMEYDHQALLAEARAVAGDRVDLAEEGKTYRV